MNLMSSRSLSESAGAEMPPPLRFTPLRFESSPPAITFVSMRVPDTWVTSSSMRPSLSSRMLPGLHVLGQVLVGATDHLLVARVDVVRGVERKRLAVLQVDLLVGEALDADLRTAEVGEDADVAARAARGFVHEVDATAVFFVFAVREVHSRDVESGADHFGQHFDGIRGRA